MVRTIPLVLARASLTLYPSDANGDPLLATPIWMGARAEQLRLEQEIAEVESTPTGATFPEYEQLGEQNFINIQRIWVIPLNTLQDYVLHRTRRGNVMVIYWEDRESGIWHRRTYHGVKGRTYNIESQGWNRQIFLSDQSFRARNFTVQEGVTGSDGQVLPTPTVEECETPLLFNWFDDAAIASGDYLVEAYQFADPVTIGFAKVIATGAAGTVTLTLEIGGSLTSQTLVIPSGAGSEQSASDTFEVEVPADTIIRWKCTSGSGATLVGLTMNVSG